VIKSGTLNATTGPGRKAQENGSQGTDHGHGNVMFVLGGSVAGGQVMSQWPFRGRSFKSRRNAPTANHEGHKNTKTKKAFVSSCLGELRG
jgi:uncharacterized protein (DUF1501 family)